MADLGHAAELVLEAVQLRGAHAQQRLDGEALASAHVRGLVDGSHAAGAEGAQIRYGPTWPERAVTAGEDGPVSAELRSLSGVLIVGDSARSARMAVLAN